MHITESRLVTGPSNTLFAGVYVSPFQPGFRIESTGWGSEDDEEEVMLNVLGCRLTYQGQAETNAEAWFNKSLRPRKPEGSLGRTAQDVHLDSHTSPEL